LGLDDTSMFEPKVSLRPNLFANGRPVSWVCSEATNESVCAFIGQSIGRATLHPLPGDNSCVEPPDPIPNSEVKRARADGSVYLACESRSLPGSLPRNPAALAVGFLFGFFACLRDVLFERLPRNLTRPLRPAGLQGECPPASAWRRMPPLIWPRRRARRSGPGSAGLTNACIPLFAGG